MPSNNVGPPRAADAAKEETQSGSLPSTEELLPLRNIQESESTAPADRTLHPSRSNSLGALRSAKFEEVALKHAWDWFSLHAAQRMQTLNLLLVSVALVLAGYGVAYQSRNFAVACVLSLAGLVVAVCFGLLDLRNRQLVRAGEAALVGLQDQLAVIVSMPELRILARVEKPDSWGITYTRMIRGITIAFSVIFLAMFLVALLSAFAVGPAAVGLPPLPSPSPSAK